MQFADDKFCRMARKSVWVNFLGSPQYVRQTEFCFVSSFHKSLIFSFFILRESKSRDDLPHDVSMHIRGAEVAAGIAVGEFFVIQT